MDKNKVYLVVAWGEPDVIFSSLLLAKKYINTTKPDDDELDSYYSVIEYIVDSEKEGEMVYDD